MHAAEESEKLAYHNVNYGRAVVTCLSQPRAVDDNVVVAHYICGNIITDHEPSFCTTAARRGEMSGETHAREADEQKFLDKSAE